MDIRPTLRFKVYVNIQLLLALIATSVFPVFYDALSSMEIFVAIFIILLTLINCCALLEKKRWIFGLELIRLASVVAYACYINQSVTMLFGCSILLYLITFSKSVEMLYFKALFGRKGYEIPLGKI